MDLDINLCKFKQLFKLFYSSLTLSAKRVDLYVTNLCIKDIQHIFVEREEIGRKEEKNRERERFESRFRKLALHYTSANIQIYLKHLFKI